MRIVIDLQSCQTTGSRSRGIGRYSMALARAMATQSNNHQLWIALNGNFLETIPQIRCDFESYIPAERIFVYEVPTFGGMPAARNDWRRSAADRIREYAIASLKPDILHISSLFEGLGDDAVTSIGSFDATTTTAVTLYDLIPLIRSETYLDNAITRSWYHSKVESLRKANLLLAISESSRQEALNYLSLPADKVVTVSTAVSDHFRPVQFSVDQTQLLQARYGLKRPFVMYTGGIDPRKNIEGLIESYAKLPAEIRNRYQLAIVCSVQPHDRNHLMAVANRYQLSAEDVVITGFVPEDDLVALYNLCELFVFPSLHEGFGLPALEAMSCGAVVIGSNSSSIPEVIGRSDALFDPTQTEQVTQSIYKGLTDQNFRSALRDFAPQQVAKFSWESSARKTLDAFEQIYDQRQSVNKVQVQVSMPKPRLALIAPLPPAKSGIAGYSAKLLEFLSDYYDITVIVNQAETDLVGFEGNVIIQSVDWFKVHAEAFDRRLYQFGNSFVHHHMFELLARYPGVVVLHDFYLSGALNWMDTFVGPPGIFTTELYNSHGYLAILTLFKESLETAITRFPLNKSVIENAADIVVHSQHSKDIANKWYGKNASKDWHVIPHLHASLQQISKKEARSKLQFKEDDFVICSFGVVAPTKLSERLLNAWLNSKLANDQRCHLIFVGENHKGEYGQQLIALINKRGMQERIKITGFASTQSYGYHLAAADMAVQLRTLSRGETSGAVLEVLPHKLPLVINSHGSMAEYPDDIVTKLPDDFSDQQLVQAIETLYEDASLRQKLGQAGYRYVTEHHAPEKVASLYRDVIEACISDSSYASYQQLLASFKDIPGTASHSDADLAASAEAIARNLPKFGKPQLLVDISNLMQGRLSKKDSSVLKASVINLLKQPIGDYRAEPIYFDGKIYRYARVFTLKLLNLKMVRGLENDPVDISKKDLFFGLNTEKTLTAESLYCLMKWHQVGTQIYLAIFDDLPKESFRSKKPTANAQDWAQALLNITRCILCTSPEMMQQIKTQLEHENLPKLPIIRCWTHTDEAQSAFLDFLPFIE
jgi:glycosyltransferase involved in cell wall biosynthesis